MQRVSNWATRLHVLISSCNAVVFQWGKFDCAQFARRWIREATGVDVLVAAGISPSYSDEAGAEAIFLSGFSDLGAFTASIAAANSMPEYDLVTFAQRGDIVWVDNSTPDTPSPYGALGVVGPDCRYAWCMGPQGTRRVHMNRWKRAWKV